MADVVRSSMCVTTSSGNRTDTERLGGGGEGTVSEETVREETEGGGARPARRTHKLKQSWTHAPANARRSSSPSPI